MPKNKSIQGVEIFSTGKWNGDTFTEADLDAMVASFQATKKHIPPFLKLGHDDDQKLLQADGLPAAGWVENLYRFGSKLMADFRDIPDKIYQLIDAGAYRKVSIELYQGLEILDKKFSHLIGAVSLLGADTPGVMNLDDILARYGLKDYDSKIKGFTDGSESTKIYEYKQKPKEGGSMPEINQDLIDAKVKIKNLEASIAKFETDLTAKTDAESKLSKELTDAKALLDETRKEFAASAEKLKAAEIESQVAKLQGAKLITPAMKPFVSQLLDGEKKEFSIEKDKEVKPCSRFDLIQETLKLAQASDVNFDDNSLDNAGKKSKFSVENAEKEITAYIDEHDCDYATAYKAVSKKFDSQAASAQDEDE